MITVDVKKKNDEYQRIIIKGHSGYALSGSDIVCASVSSISITTLNAIMRLEGNVLQCKEDDGLLDIQVLSCTPSVRILFDNMVALMKELQISYGKYLKINE